MFSLSSLSQLMAPSGNHGGHDCGVGWNTTVGRYCGRGQGCMSILRKAQWQSFMPNDGYTLNVNCTNTEKLSLSKVLMLSSKALSISSAHTPIFFLTLEACLCLSRDLVTQGSSYPFIPCHKFAARSLGSTRWVYAWRLWQATLEISQIPPLNTSSLAQSMAIEAPGKDMLGYRVRRHP